MLNVDNPTERVWINGDLKLWRGAFYNNPGPVGLLIALAYIESFCGIVAVYGLLAYGLCDDYSFFGFRGAALAREHLMMQSVWFQLHTRTSLCYLVAALPTSRYHLS